MLSSSLNPQLGDGREDRWQIAHPIAVCKFNFRAGDGCRGTAARFPTANGSGANASSSVINFSVELGEAHGATICDPSRKLTMRSLNGERVCALEKPHGGRPLPGCRHRVCHRELRTGS